MKNIIVWLIIIVLIATGLYFLLRDNDAEEPEIEEETSTEVDTTVASSTEAVNEAETVLGQSKNGNDIVAYHFGSGTDEIVFVGGIHGGYSWNTSLVAYELIDYLESDESVIPENVKVTIVPVLNPDGLEKVTGSTGRFSASDVTASEDVLVEGRFNANNVDLNRNFDCDWQEEATWQSQTVSGGSAAFSENESRAIADYIDKKDPKAVVAYYSAAGGVFASNCHSGVLAETSQLTDVYAKASGYRAFQSFDFYETTGDMTNWLAKERIPAISVLLTDHKNLEWPKNRAGAMAVLEFYATSETNE